MILETLVSDFSSTRNTEVIKDSVTVGVWLERIQNGTFKRDVDQVRGGNDNAKKNLPTVAFHGVFEAFRKKADFIEASGLIILDIDDVEISEIEETKKEIMEDSNNVLACMKSPTGNGIKVLYYIQPELVNADNYRQIGKQLVSDFDIYGDVDYLSVTDCLIMTYDPAILINREVEPAFIYITDVIPKDSKLEKLDESREFWDDAEDFFDTVLATDIEQKTNNNFHYIQVAILDLAKFGFRHPKEDLSFVVDYAEASFKSSPENKKRFDEVTRLAESYPQQHWPYKMISSDEPDDEYVDYSDYVDSDSVKDEKSESTEEESNGLIDYSTLLERVVEVVKEGDRVGFEISLKNFAEIFRIKGTGILTVTGIPGHGKTEWVDQMILDLARLFGHESIIVGFEQTPEEHLIKIIRKLIGTNVTCPSWFNKSNEPEFKQAFNFVTKKIKHIDTNKTGGNINEILEIAAKRIKESRDEGGDPKYIVLDPFNMLSIKGRFSGHEKIEEILRRLTHFSHQMGVLVILVAHPFKMRTDEKTGEYAVPDFYSVKGSSAFFEMSYHGLTVYRKGYDTNVLIKVLKVKQNNLGQSGAEVYFNYEKGSGRYIPIDEEGNETQNVARDRDWLEKAIKQTSINTKEKKK